MAATGRQRVAVVTGGGAGIGAAIAEELGRAGLFVVTLDPLVTIDGAEALESTDDTTAARIVAAGGSARASSMSVTDRDGVRQLFDDLAGERGGVDVVVNSAGISRPTSFTRGTEEDWRSILAVHLDGYRNVLEAALPHMAEAGHGRIVGVTSGSGWRPADTGAYGCAKRAVASLTWQLGAAAPAGVVLNAVSPIAMTRMVTAALGRSRPPTSGGASPSSTSGSSSATGGLSLGSMPAPEQIAPLVAHLAGEHFSACRGQVLFAAGSELAVVEPPRFLEVVASDGPAGLDRVLEAVTASALAPAEAEQHTTGGSNPRLPSFDQLASATPHPPAGRCCAVVAERTPLADAIRQALEARGVTCIMVDPDRVGDGFEPASAVLAAAAGDGDDLDGVVVALSGDRRAGGEAGWERVLDEHAGVADGIFADATWSRAVAERAGRTGAPVRLVTLTTATTTGGRSRAQASAQLARAGRKATDELVSAFAVSVESDSGAAAEAAGQLAAHLVASPEAAPLAGAELMVGAGSIGLRSHPRAATSVVLGDANVPGWLDDVLRETTATTGGGR